MTATRVQFASYVDTKGYKIVPAKRPRPGQSEADWVYSVPVSELAGRIVPIGGALRVLLLSNYPLLFSKFVNVQTPDELLRFITEYGPLTYSRFARGKGDEIPRLLDEAASMKECFKSRGRHSGLMADLTASLSIDHKKGTVSVEITPVRLLDALWLQLGQALSDSSKWRQCGHCRGSFPVGGNSGRRSDARFCTDECRIKFNSLERSR